MATIHEFEGAVKLHQATRGERSFHIHPLPGSNHGCADMYLFKDQLGLRGRGASIMQSLGSKTGNMMVCAMYGASVSERCDGGKKTVTGQRKRKRTEKWV